MPREDRRLPEELREDGDAAGALGAFRAVRSNGRGPHWPRARGGGGGVDQGHGSAPRDHHRGVARGVWRARGGVEGVGWLGSAAWVAGRGVDFEYHADAGDSVRRRFDAAAIFRHGFLFKGRARAQDAAAAADPTRPKPIPAGHPPFLSHLDLNVGRFLLKLAFPALSLGCAHARALEQRLGRARRRPETRALADGERALGVDATEEPAVVVAPKPAVEELRGRRSSLGATRGRRRCGASRSMRGAPRRPTRPVAGVRPRTCSHRRRSRRRARSSHARSSTKLPSRTAHRRARARRPSSAGKRTTPRPPADRVPRRHPQRRGRVAAAGERDEVAAPALAVRAPTHRDARDAAAGRGSDAHEVAAPRARTAASRHRRARRALGGAKQPLHVEAARHAAAPARGGRDRAAASRRQLVEGRVRRGAGRQTRRRTPARRGP